MHYQLYSVLNKGFPKNNDNCLQIRQYIIRQRSIVTDNLSLKYSNLLD